MFNVRELLRALPKPNRAQHGGKGLFLSSCGAEYSLAELRALLQNI